MKTIACSRNYSSLRMFKMEMRLKHIAVPITNAKIDESITSRVLSIIWEPSSYRDFQSSGHNIGTISIYKFVMMRILITLTN